MDADKHYRFIKRQFVMGWEAQEDGLLLIYADGSREVIPMSEREALENSLHLAREIDDAIGLTWED